MKLRIAKKIFATTWGCRVGLPGGGVTWIGESWRYPQAMVYKALKRLAKVKGATRFKYMGHPSEMWADVKP